jgi:cytochrome c oxidase subunit 3
MIADTLKAPLARRSPAAHDAAALDLPGAESVAIPHSSSVSTGQLTVMALLATAGMLFAGFASAYLVRREGTDWVREPLPAILIFSTTILLISSATLEVSRSALRRGESTAALLWAAATALLGLAFLAGQLDAWKQLAAQGVYLPSGPYSSFFYVLTAVHGVHLGGGIIALAYLLWRIWRSEPGRGVMDVFKGCATYWHFVGGVWLLLYLLLRTY